MTSIIKNTKYEILTPSGWSDFDGIKTSVKSLIYHITFTDNTFIKCTDNHLIKFWDDEFIEAKYLNIGDELSNEKIVAEITIIEKETEVFDPINVKRKNEYYSNGIISHNCAFIEGVDEIWAAAQLTLATGGSAILLSTPNGVGNLFHQMCARALEGTSEGDGLGKFNLISLPWQLHPERDQAWRDEQTKLLGPRIAAQETDCSFETSGHTVMEAEVIKYYKESMCKDPIAQAGPGGDYWYWKYPEYNTDYIITADISRGDGSDYSAFEVYDIVNNEQVAEFVGKMGTRDFGRMLCAVGHEWNQALLVPDNKNIGWDTIQEIIDKQYPNLFYSYQNDPYMDPEKHIRKNYDLKQKEDMIPGFTTTTRTRPVMISKIETYYNVDKSPIRYSRRLINQYEVFIWKDSKAQAQYGYNDDLVMCDAMVLYMRDTTMKMRQQGLELTKKAITHFGQSTPIYISKHVGPNPWQMQTGQSVESLKWLL